MDRIKVTFRFVGNRVNPQHLTEVLALEPSSSRVKGAIVEKHPTKRYPTNYWGIESAVPATESLATHIAWLLDLLEPRADAIENLKKSGYEPNFFLWHISHL